MSAVLVTVINGEKVLNSGTGIVLGHDQGTGIAPQSWVLTCAHTLQALRGRNTDSSIKVTVNGVEAQDIEDELLAKYDLAVLMTKGRALNLSPAKLTIANNMASVECVGFTCFYQKHFERRVITGKVIRRIPAVMEDGRSVEYVEIQPAEGTEGFAKGFSGGPAYDERGNVIAISRILGNPTGSASTKTSPSHAYALGFSQEVMQIVQEKLPPAIAQNWTFSPVATADVPAMDEPPPKPRRPVNMEDIQKGRWGGKSEGHGRRLTIENVREYRRYFSFNAVLERVGDDVPMKGPFIFHLHDSYDKSVIWIRKTNGFRAVLEEVDAVGTYTIGVQFKDAAGHWRELEYDLVDYKDGRLKKFDE